MSKQTKRFDSFITIIVLPIHLFCTYINFYFELTSNLPSSIKTYYNNFTIKIRSLGILYKMSFCKRRYESFLFNHETTTRADFRPGQVLPIVRTEYKEKPTCLRIRPSPLKDVHSLTDWYNPNVPFHLMHKPMDVVRTNPRVGQKPYSEPEDVFRERVRLTRPRLVMTPAASLDDVEPIARKLLLDDVYTTTVMKMHKESGVKAGLRVQSPLPECPATADPIALAKLKPPLVSPEWRMASAAWDHHQLRTYCTPTRSFWLARTPQ